MHRDSLPPLESATSQASNKPIESHVAQSMQSKPTSSILIIALIVSIPILLAILLYLIPQTRQAILSIFDPTASTAQSSSLAGRRRAMEAQIESANQPAISLESGTIVYAEADKVFAYDSLTGKSTSLPITLADQASSPMMRIRNLSFSPEGSILTFIHNDRFYLYDYDAMQLIGSAEIMMGSGTNVQLTSPDGQYFIVDAGSSPGNRGRVLIDRQGQVLANFLGAEVAWLPDSSGFFLAIGEELLDVLAYGPEPYTNSVYFINVDNPLEPELILKADRQTHYIPLGWQADDQLLIKQHVYAQAFPKEFDESEWNDQDKQQVWIDLYENPSVSYLSLNPGTRLTTPAEATPTMSDTYRDQTYSPSRAFKLEIKDNQLYVGPSNSTERVLIAPANSAVWRPE